MELLGARFRRQNRFGWRRTKCSDLMDQALTADRECGGRKSAAGNAAAISNFN
jgi:hypothetical protein